MWQSNSSSASPLSRSRDLFQPLILAPDFRAFMDALSAWLRWMARLTALPTEMRWSVFLYRMGRSSYESFETI